MYYLAFLFISVVDSRRGAIPTTLLIVFSLAAMVESGWDGWEAFLLRLLSGLVLAIPLVYWYETGRSGLGDAIVVAVLGYRHGLSVGAFAVAFGAIVLIGALRTDQFPSDAKVPAFPALLCGDLIVQGLYR